MRKLSKPPHDALDVYRACISRIGPGELKDLLAAAEPHIQLAVRAHNRAAAKAAFFKLRPQETLQGIPARQMAKVYDQRMARKSAPGRYIYDQLMSAPAHGRCPYCGQRTVSTLDHYLPKALFPALVVAPENLVPACRDCNSVKSDTFPQSADKQFLHPYFDDVGNDNWLFASVVEDSPPALRFSVKAPAEWDQVFTERVRYHFQELRLAELYGSHAAEELENIRYQLELVHRVAGSDGVRQHLTERRDSYRHSHPNSWQSAMFAALVSSDWFCEEGFAR